jgi:hypothetical protein
LDAFLSIIFSWCWMMGGLAAFSMASALATRALMFEECIDERVQRHFIVLAGGV